ncbi:recombinase family protein [Solwaraspora sp. WMMD1047]|uniref:recombinase family protein n=1 Tax=Solwaraspora sp. WMMD1047 TaxID=3016102 RepID=UPI0024159759|nr:recombinase family protein [Solwaraspora sp. WMMD1047]MDG4829080.1 recombinase family protein [Solwaraspora sp. WMMD1047]
MAGIAGTNAVSWGYDPTGWRSLPARVGTDALAQVIQEEHAEVIREAARRVASGEACYSIAQDFNARGIPTPRGGKKGWSLSQIGRMLQNPGVHRQAGPPRQDRW